MRGPYAGKVSAPVTNQAGGVTRRKAIAPSNWHARRSSTVSTRSSSTLLPGPGVLLKAARGSYPESICSFSKANPAPAAVDPSLRQDAAGDYDRVRITVVEGQKEAGIQGFELLG